MLLPCLYFWPESQSSTSSHTAYAGGGTAMPTRIYSRPTDFEIILPSSPRATHFNQRFLIHRRNIMRARKSERKGRTIGVEEEKKKCHLQNFLYVPVHILINVASHCFVFSFIILVHSVVLTHSLTLTHASDSSRTIRRACNAMYLEFDHILLFVYLFQSIRSNVVWWANCVSGVTSSTCWLEYISLAFSSTNCLVFGPHWRILYVWHIMAIYECVCGVR